MPRKPRSTRNRKLTPNMGQSSRAYHDCGWPNCTKAAPKNSWGCTPHMATLPMDLRKKVATAFGPPKAEWLPKVEAEIRQWVANQNPANYRKGLFPGRE